MSFIRDSKAQLVQQGQAFLSNKQVLKDSLLSLAICHPNIAVLNFGNIAVRRDYPTYDCVKIISGGPSGHEPAHGAYVGRGMLTVAVQGELNKHTSRIVSSRIRYRGHFYLAVFERYSARDSRGDLQAEDGGRGNNRSERYRDLPELHGGRADGRQRGRAPQVAHGQG